MLTGVYTFTSAIVDASRLVMPSDRGEFEFCDSIDLRIRRGRTIDALRRQPSTQSA